MSITVSIIIPARNEAALIEETLRSIQSAVDLLPVRMGAEIVVVDNGSVDETRQIVQKFGRSVRLVDCTEKGAARARNAGARTAVGQLLVFVDADTMLPASALVQVVDQCTQSNVIAGICKLGTREGGLRASCWWFFWNSVRLLPIPRAKAMPAFMFCTRDVFEKFGPFDEQVAIGEEWPILAGVYRERPREFAYLRSITAQTSNRRMDLAWFGYTRLFLKYVWAILDYRGRIHYSDTIRHVPVAAGITSTASHKVTDK